MDCNFSHNTKDFPCKYLHGTGKCEKAQDCVFKHDLMSSQAEIQKFMRDNEDFLSKILKDTGKTNLSDYFLIYLREKEECERLASLPKDLILPPSLVNDQSKMQNPAQN